LEGEKMKNLDHAELSMQELQTYSDSQAEDIEIWKGRVKSLEEENEAMRVSAVNAWDEYCDLMNRFDELKRVNEQLKADLIAADARGDE
jgi:predicted nuclease with TOPRIM domain